MAKTLTIANRRITIELGPVKMGLERLKIQLAARTQVALRIPFRAHLAESMVSFAPQPGEEKDILVRGTITKAWSRFMPGAGARILRRATNAIRSASPGSFGRVGTGDKGRFLKQGNQLFLVDALRLQKMRVRKTRLGLGSPKVKVSGVFGNWKHMARRTSFTYIRMKRQGSQLVRSSVETTMPFNKDWPRTANHGGTWLVIPRPKGGKRFGILHPEPGVYAREMLKTVKPFRYAEKGLKKTIGWFAKTINPMVVVPAMRAAGFRQKRIGGRVA